MAQFAKQVEDPSASEGYTSLAFHPDGLILGTGTTGCLVKIWDVKSQTAASDGIKLWDLRKLKNFRTFTPYGLDTPTNFVEFGYSGSYLAAAGSDISC